MSILTKLGEKAVGLNWYAIGLKLALLGILITATWMQATKHCELKHERQRTEQAQRQVDEVVKRVPEVQQQARDSIKRQQRIEDSGRKLDEATKANPSGSCNSSDDQ